MSVMNKLLYTKGLNMASTADSNFNDNYVLTKYNVCVRVCICIILDSQPLLLVDSILFILETPLCYFQRNFIFILRISVIIHFKKSYQTKKTFFHAVC